MDLKQGIFIHTKEHAVVPLVLAVIGSKVRAWAERTTSSSFGSYFQVANMSSQVR